MSNIHIFEYSNGFYQGEVQGNARQGMGVYMWDSGQFHYGILVAFYHYLHHFNRVIYDIYCYFYRILE